MNITEITVSAHEKRNHPYEYGHYDAEVSYTATVGVADDILKVTKELQYLADSFVREKCGQWISLVNLERKVAAFEATFRSRLNNAVWTNDEAEAERRLQRSRTTAATRDTQAHQRTTAAAAGRHYRQGDGMVPLTPHPAPTARQRWRVFCCRENGAKF